MSYTVHQAKTHLSRLLREVEDGKEIIITRGRKPVARITSLEDQPITKRRIAGGFEGLVHAEDSAFDPLTDKELGEYGFGFLDDKGSNRQNDKPGAGREPSE